MNSKQDSDNNKDTEKSNNSAFDRSPQLCRVCKSPINEGAKKCITCGCYQSTLRSFLSGIDLQSLVTLIPVMTLAFVFLKDQFIPAKAELQLAALACSGDKIKIAAVNTGELDALFGGASLLSETSLKIPLQFANNDEQELVIQSGNTRVYDLVALDTFGNTLGLNLSPDNPCQYYLKPNSYSFQIDSEAQPLRCACPES